MVCQRDYYDKFQDGTQKSVEEGKWWIGFHM